MSKGKLLAVCVVWLVILAMGVGVWRVGLCARRRAVGGAAAAGGTPAGRVGQPLQVAAADRAGRVQRLRGAAFARVCRRPTQAGRQADAQRRTGPTIRPGWRRLKRGDADMAVFTIDALVKASAQGGQPAGDDRRALIDDTVGADAIVAYKEDDSQRRCAEPRRHAVRADARLAERDARPGRDVAVSDGPAQRFAIRHGRRPVRGDRPLQEGPAGGSVRLRAVGAVRLAGAEERQDARRGRQLAVPVGDRRRARSKRRLHRQESRAGSSRR